MEDQLPFSPFHTKTKLNNNKNLISQADTTEKPRAAEARLFFNKFIAACCASTFSSNRNHLQSHLGWSVVTGFSKHIPFIVTVTSGCLRKEKTKTCRNSIYLAKIRARRQQYQGQPGSSVGALSKLYASLLPMSLECVEINAFIQAYNRHPGEKQMGSGQSSDSTPFTFPLLLSKDRLHRGLSL